MSEKHLVDIIRKHKAIVDKLPKYADTGEAFVPDADPCWVEITMPDGKDEIIEIPNKDGWFCLAYRSGKWSAIWTDMGNECTIEFYSTQAAAEAAKKGKDNG